MTNTALWNRRKQALGPTYSHFYDEPINIVKGEGVCLYDEIGSKYFVCYILFVYVCNCFTYFFIVFSFGWNPKTTMKEDVGSIPIYRKTLTIIDYLF